MAVVVKPMLARHGRADASPSIERSGVRDGNFPNDTAGERYIGGRARAYTVVKLTVMRRLRNGQNGREAPTSGGAIGLKCETCHCDIGEMWRGAVVHAASARAPSAVTVSGNRILKWRLSCATSTIATSFISSASLLAGRAAQISLA